MNTERGALMRRLQCASFCALDASLFLDTHSNDQRALQYYRQTLEQKNKLEQEYSSKYGPLTVAQAGNGDKWDWTNLPWPWEGEE